MKGEIVQHVPLENKKCKDPESFYSIISNNWRNRKKINWCFIFVTLYSKKIGTFFFSCRPQTSKLYLVEMPIYFMLCLYNESSIFRWL